VVLAAVTNDGPVLKFAQGGLNQDADCLKASGLWDSAPVAYSRAEQVQRVLRPRLHQHAASLPGNAVHLHTTFRSEPVKGYQQALCYKLLALRLPFPPRREQGQQRIHDSGRRKKRTWGRPED